MFYFFKKISVISKILLFISFAIFCFLVVGIWGKYTYSDFAQFGGTIIAALMTVVFPDIYNVIQKESDERKDRRKNSLLITRVLWELRENEIRLKNTLSNDKNLGLDTHYIASIVCVVWENSNIEIELEKGLYTDIFKLYAALRLLKGTYYKVKSSELKEVIEIIIERMDDVIEELSFKVTS